MAHIFKHPDNGTKGIIVFTHKEFYLLSSRSVSKKEKIKRLVSFKKNYLRYLLLKRFKKSIGLIGKYYYVGVHWGFYARDIETPSWVDFHMTSPGTTTFNGDPFVIPLSSAHFTPLVMTKENGCEKYWDLICVAKNDIKKKYPELLSSVKKLYEMGEKYRILFVIASNSVEKKSAYYTSILDDYFEVFSAEEREMFTIIKTDPKTGFQGLSYTMLSYFYNRSKVFTLFSQVEGHAKVVKEAQLCGMPIVVKNDLRGGVKDSLNEKNSLFFSDYDNAHLVLKKAIDNYTSFNVDVESLESELGEKKSLERLCHYFKVLYEKNDSFFDGNLINTSNLNRRLPAHYFDESIKWASSSKFRFTTTDITNLEMMELFLLELKCGVKI
ncbi:glycosyltransferase [Marinomonas sp. A79]|uniref:Glycosyltransferase n=1 Tax=Marinomonas vulgaris TaxID=2823372 RepID=A0ABS5H7Q5_9GAMM|nr:glycosyltransferase [Marinomonas vulgaris]MBR7887585.1 glycosyltransferase [Marinomonas vulgaris]